MSRELLNLLTNFSNQLQQRQKGIRHMRIAKAKVENDGRQSIANLGSPSVDVSAFFDTVKAAVELERRRYTVTAPMPAPNAAEMDGTVSAVPAAAPAKAPAATPSVLHTSLFLRGLVQDWQTVSSLLPVMPVAGLSPGAQACYAFMTHELSVMGEENAQNGPKNTPQPLLVKIKQAVQAFSEQRTADTITLLKNGLNADPHNHTLLAMLSQVTYQMAASGQQTVLPEARDHAHHSIVHTDRIKPERLELYRYLAVVSERDYDEERALMWLRDGGLLDPAHLSGKDGLMGNSGLSLRAWAILGTISPSLWNEREFKAVHELVSKVVGGAAIYVAWLRMPMLQAQAVSKVPINLIEETERLVSTAYSFYDEVARSMQQLPLQTSNWPWFVRVRYLHGLIQMCPLPAFDQVLCMISLDGQTWVEGVFPDAEMQTILNDGTLHYWKTWAQTITPFKDVRKPYLLPAEETARDGELLGMCDQMLQALQTAERQLIKAHVWDELRPWMPRWQMDHLLAAGTGSNKPRSRFQPSLIPYTHFYRNWQEPLPTSQLASEVMAETAKRGAFSSLFEIQAAFEGCLRLLHDPVHGLVPSQKRAYAAAKRHNPTKYNNLNVDFGGVSGGGFAVMLVPLAGLGALAGIYQMSANMSQAIGLSLALAGVAGVVMVNLKK